MKVLQSFGFKKLSYTNLDTLPGNFNGPHRGIASDLFGARSDENPSFEQQEEMWNSEEEDDTKEKKKRKKKTRQKQDESEDDERVPKKML